MKRNLLYLFAVLLLILAGCTAGSTTSSAPPEDQNPSGENGGPDTNDPDSEEGDEDGGTGGETSLLDYFLPDNSSAHYKGEGMEFAELDIEVYRPHEDYVVIHENNGGTLMQKVYKLEGNEIQLVKQEPTEELNPPVPSLEELQQLEPQAVYLKAPIEVGTSFDDWTIIETDAAVETPYEPFTDVVVLEEIKENITNRKYLVKDFGEVKRESVMTEEGADDYVVTSTLETVTIP